MRGTRAKQIRKLIYGDMSLKVRQYYTYPNGQVIRDDTRRQYQKAKEVYYG